jgi:hypothetical protein
LVWLEYLGLSQYKNIFSAHSVDGSVLLVISANELAHDLHIFSAQTVEKILKAIDFETKKNVAL